MTVRHMSRVVVVALAAAVIVGFLRVAFLGVPVAQAAFPSIVGTATSSRSTNVADDTILLPSGVTSGDLLIVFHFSDGGGTRTFPAGWNEIKDTTCASSFCNVGVAYRIATGTVTSVTSTKSVAERFSAIAVRISSSSWHGTTPPEISTGATGTSANPNPDAVTASWGSADNLFIAVHAFDNSAGGGSTTAYPTSYASNQTQSPDVSSAARGAIASQSIASSTDNPGTFTVSASDEWWSGTVVIRPAAGGGGDSSPPTPNPMSFSSAPNDTGTSSISMTATTGSDTTTPVEYLFTSTSCVANGGTGGTSSSWQTSTSYSDAGLQTNKCYAYTVTARDSVSPTPNTGSASASSSAYTAAAVPGTPTLSGATTSTLNLTNAENGNPSSSPTTYFAAQVVSSTPNHAAWAGKYVDASGNPTSTAVWLTDAALDGMTLRGLATSTTYGVKVKARNESSEETSFGSEGQGTTSAGGGGDSTAPTPNPMTFASAPNDASTSSISMTATTASDPSTPIEYSFTFAACGANGGTGGTSSSWQTSTSYTDTGLQTNKCYGYTIAARDSIPNTGAASASSEAYTAANVPGTPTLGGATASTLDLTNAENGNPASSPTTYFAAQIVTTSPSDATWLNKYVDASGNPSASAVWLTDAQLDAMTLQGLVASTTYGVQVKARNESSEETSFGSEGQGTTSAGGGGGIALVGNATGTAFSSATVSPTANLPSGVQSGHLLLAWIVTNTNATTSALTGWTQVGSRVSPGTDSSEFLLYRVSDGAEGSSWTFTNLFTATEIGMIVATAWSGVDTSSPINASSGTASTAVTSVSGPSITPSQNDTMIVQFVGTDPSTSAYAATDDASPDATEIFDAKESSGNSNAYAAIQYYLQGTAAALALDYNPITSDDYGYFQVALNPSAGGGGNSPPSAPTQNSPSNGATDQSTTPTFTMTTTDPDADKLQYKVTIYSDAGCSSVVQTNDQGSSQTGWSGQNTTCVSGSDCYTSGTQGTYATQSALSNGTTYYWRASAQDPLGSDTFTDSATCNSFSTVASGGTYWTIDSGSWSISSNALAVSPSAGTYAQIHATGEDRADAVVDVRVKASITGSGDAGPVLRADASANRYVIGNISFASSLHRILKFISSASSTLTSTAYSPSAGTYYQSRASLSGTSLASWINGGTARSATDSSLGASGFIGLGAYRSGSAVTFTYDNFAVYTGVTITLNNLPASGSWSVRNSAGTAVSPCLTSNSWDFTVSGYTGGIPIDYDNGGGSVAVWAESTGCSPAGSPTVTYPASGLANDIVGGDTYSYTAAGGGASAATATSSITVSATGLISYSP